MKSQYKFALFGLLLVLTLSLTSAITTMVSAPSSVSHNSGSFTFTLNVTNNETETIKVNFTSFSLTQASSISISNISSLASGATTSITGTVSYASQQSGSITVSFIATPSNDSDVFTNSSVSFSVPITSSTSASVSQTAFSRTQNSTLTITNTGNTVLSSLSLAQSGTLTLGLSSSTISSIAVAGTSQITVYPSNANSLPTLGTHTSTLTITNSTGSTLGTATFSLNRSACTSGSVGSNLSITGIEISSDGEDDSDWMPLDNIDIEVDVENLGSDKISDIIVELLFFDSSGSNKVKSFDFSNADEHEFDLGSLDEDEDGTAKFEFQVPADFKDGDYKLAVKVYSDDISESSLCTDSSSDLDNLIYEDISIERESDEGKFIAFQNILISPTEAVCGDSVTLSFDMINIGEDDQDRVKYTLYNKDLNLNLYQEVNALDSGDMVYSSFTFDLPSNVSEKDYVLLLSSSYDYRDGEYRETSDDSESIKLKVIGCDSTLSSQTRLASISASLESDASAGEEMKVKTTISNPSTSTITYLLAVKGYESWAKFDSMSDSSLTLAPGEIKEFTTILIPNEDVSGDKTFYIEVYANGQSDSRTVTVSIDKPGLFNFGDNSLIWIIGAINVVIILTILVAAIKIIRRN